MPGVEPSLHEHHASDVIVIGTRRATRALLLGGLGAILAAQLWGFGPSAFVFFVFWLPMSTRSPAHPLGSGVLRIAGRRLSLEGTSRQRELELARVAEGWVRSGALRHEAIVRLADDRLLVGTFVDERSARDFLTSAGVARGTRRVRLSDHCLGSKGIGRTVQTVLHSLLRAGAPLLVAGLVIGVLAMVFPPLRGALGGLLALGALARVAAVMFLLLVAVALANLAFVPSVQLGLDGLVLRSLGLRRFIPYREVRTVHQAIDGVLLELEDGNTLLLPMTSSSHLLKGSAGPTARDADELVMLRETLCDQLAERIERAHVAPDPQLVRLVAQGRVHTEHYRAPGLSFDAVAELLESPAATPEQRLDAARALAAQGDPTLHRKIRVTAEQCVDSELATELERIAEPGTVPRAAHTEASLDEHRRRARV
jgi:hypothetical protein